MALLQSKDIPLEPNVREHVTRLSIKLEDTKLQSSDDENGNVVRALKTLLMKSLSPF